MPAPTFADMDTEVAAHHQLEHKVFYNIVEISVLSLFLGVV